MSWISAGITAGGAIISGIGAYRADKQASEAKKRQEELIKNRPQYEIPAEYQKNVDLQQGVVKGYEPYTKTSQLAGQSYMQNRIDANTANQMALASQQGVSSPSALASLYGSAMNAQGQATTDMNIQGAENRQKYQQLSAQATGQLAEANKDLAVQKEGQWSQNVFSPYASAVEGEKEKIKDYTGRARERLDTTISQAGSAGSMAGSYLGSKKGNVDTSGGENTDGAGMWINGKYIRKR